MGYRAREARQERGPKRDGQGCNARQGNDPARFAVMTFREFECALGWEIAGRYNQQIHSALLRPPVALWREHVDHSASSDERFGSAIELKRFESPLRRQISATPEQRWAPKRASDRADRL
jgi:hypothetical protein